jgi:superfamily II DNA or RNA helicase
VFATVQSLRGTHLARLLAHGPLTHLVIDESHHPTAETYLTLLAALWAANSALRHLGVTATPLRADGDGLARGYQKDSFKVTIGDLVKLGYLVQPRWLGIVTGLSLKGVHTRSGDLAPGELADVYDTPAGRRIIVAAYQQYVAARPGGADHTSA